MRLLSAALLLTAVGCAREYVLLGRVDAPARPMRVQEAKVSLAAALREKEDVTAVHDVRWTRKRISFKIEYQGHMAHCYVDFESVGALTLQQGADFIQDDAFAVMSDGKVLGLMVNDQRMFSAFFMTRSAATSFAQALLVLKTAAAAPVTEEADFAAFADRAKVWREAGTRPALPDSALTFKAVAEDAFKRRDITAALDAYGEALEKHPMWPEGQYNAALLAAEVEDYELAVHHMRRYLALSPDAKDAAASKEKLLLWQHKAGPSKAERRD